MTFSAGDLSIDRGKMRNSDKLEFLLVKLAVGESFCVEEQEYLSQPISSPPEGFDSLYLYSPKEKDEGYSYKYVVFESHQVKII